MVHASSGSRCHTDVYPGPTDDLGNLRMASTSPDVNGTPSIRQTGQALGGLLLFQRHLEGVPGTGPVSSGKCLVPRRELVFDLAPHLSTLCVGVVA